MGYVCMIRQYKMEKSQYVDLIIVHVRSKSVILTWQQRRGQHIVFAGLDQLGWHKSINPHSTSMRLIIQVYMLKTARNIFFRLLNTCFNIVAILVIH